MIRQAILKVTNKENLSVDDAKAVMYEIANGEATSAQIAAFLTGLAMKGETVDEIVGCVNGIRMAGIQLPIKKQVLELAGTGGDHARSINISTISAMIVSAGGVLVAKHGNKSSSSLCGSADCLERLGVNIELSPDKSSDILEKIGVCFLFAQIYHPVMKRVSAIRKELGIHTIFNIIGPLSNPAGATLQLLGVYEERLVQPLAKVIHELGVERGMVVHGQDVLDEISMSAPTTVCELVDGRFLDYEITPECFGYKRCSKKELEGGSSEENAIIARAILEGRLRGPKRNAVCMNAGAALYIGGKADSLIDGARLAEKLIDTGLALKKLEQFIAESNR